MNKHTTALGLTAFLLVAVPILAAAVLALDGYLAHAATITITTTADELNTDGDCSLREAIEAANTNAPVDACLAGEPGPIVDVITFSVTGTITLTSGQLTVSNDLTIDGPGAANLTISGNDSSRVLEVSAGTTADVRDLTLANGSAAGADGGGIHNAGTLNVTSATISQNSAANVNTVGGSGGGIYNSGALTVTDSTFSENSASFGGGIDNAFGTLTVTSSAISTNSADSGGGVSSRGSLTVTDSTFSANSALTGGGIAGDGTITITDSTFSANSATASPPVIVGGGAILNGCCASPGTLSITNTTLSGNSAVTNGGGIYNSGVAGPVTATNATFSGNSAGGEGNSIFNEGSATLSLRNTIVANNTSGGDCSGTITSAGHNLSSDNTCGFDSDPANPDATDGDWVNTDPRLAPLANYGGPTETHALCTASVVPDASCAGASPAIDTGDNVGCPSTDQRGFVPRPADGNGDSIPVCDIGSYEVGAAAPTPSPSPSPTPSPACLADDNDFDNDGTPNKRDKGDDNDGIHDGPDSDDDNDATPDGQDPDDDNDGTPDTKDKDDGQPFCPDDHD